MISTPEDYAILTVFAGAIATLWRVVIKSKTDSEDRERACEKRVEGLRKSHVEMTAKVARLEGKVELAEALGPKIDEMHAEITRRSDYVSD